MATPTEILAILAGLLHPTPNNRHPFLADEMPEEQPRRGYSGKLVRYTKKDKEQSKKRRLMAKHSRRINRGK